MIRQSDMFDPSVAHLEPWDAGDVPLLEKLNDPEMTKHVGRPESPEKLAERQSRCKKTDSRQYKIVAESGDEHHHRYVHAFPMVENAPSNVICRKLGFAFVEMIDFPARQEGSCGATTGTSTSSRGE